MSEKVVTIPRLPPAPESPAARLLQYDARSYLWDQVSAVFVDRSGWRIVLATRTAENLFGYGLGEMVGLSVHDLVPDGRRAAHESHVEEFAAEPFSTARPMGQGLELEGRHRTGRSFPVSVALYRFMHEGHQFVMAVVTPLAGEKP